MKYRVEIEFDGWFATEVDAASKNEAQQKAEEELREQCDLVRGVLQSDVMYYGDDEVETMEE